MTKQKNPQEKNEEPKIGDLLYYDPTGIDLKSILVVLLEIERRSSGAVIYKVLAQKVENIWHKNPFYDGACYFKKVGE